VGQPASPRPWTWTARRISPYCSGVTAQWNQIAWTAGALAAAVPAGWVARRIVRHYAEPPPPLALTLAATAAIFTWAAAVTPAVMVLALSLVLGWMLLTLALVDVRAFRLPDPLTLPLLAAGLVGAFLLPDLLPDPPLWNHLAGAAIGYGVLAAIGWAFWRVRGEEGLGLGDAKLLGAGGAWLGWRALPSVLIIACLLAFALIAIRAAFQGPASVRRRIAFGAPLCAAIWVVWLAGRLAT